MIKRIRHLLKKAEMDRAVIFLFSTKILSLITGPISVLLIAMKFTPVTQGYYYTFVNLISLQMFVELGFGYVIIQFASHEWSRLGLGPNGEVIGDDRQLLKLAKLARFAFKWYLVAGICAFIVLCAGGSIFFMHSTALKVDWLGPWLSISGLTGIAVFLVFIWSILEGCNQVASFYTFRFVQTQLSDIGSWLAILFGLSLWVPSVSEGIAIVCGVIFLYTRYRTFIRSLFSIKLHGHALKWKDELFPMQWKFAVSGIASYFTFFIFTPVLFHYHGPVVAGQFGMAWMLTAAVSTISYSWIQARIPHFGMLIAQRKYAELDRFFRKLLILVVVLSVVFSFLAWLLVLFLNIVHFKLIYRLLSPLPILILFMGQVISFIGLPFSAYLRAHKQEPLLVLSIAQGAITAAVAFILGSRYSAIGIAIGWLFVNMINTPIIIYIWYGLRKKWHGEDLASEEIMTTGEYL